MKLLRLVVSFIVLFCQGHYALNPTFDKETLGMQVVQTNWTSHESIYDLIDIMQENIPMNVSDACNAAVRKFVFDLTQKDENALVMVDAFGKTPSGLKLGHILLFGNFDQCLANRRYNNETRKWEQVSNYCLVRLDHPLTRAFPALPAYGACLPLECANNRDSEGFVTGLFRPLRAAAELNAVHGICVSPLDKTAGFFVMAALIALLIATIIAASCVHCFFRRRYHDGNGAENGANQTLDTEIQIFDKKVVNTNGLTVTQHNEILRKSKFGYANVPTWLRPILCFHAPTNVSTIGFMANEGEIAFLHGFRVLSMWWIILGHTYYLGMNFFENRLKFNLDARSLGFQLVLNAGYAVDGFFLLSGLLITYVLMRELNKTDGKLNWLLVYFHRWWRLTPVYMFVMLIYVYVLPHGIESPWKLIIAQQGAPTEYCKSHWWTNILYINNFFPVFRNKQCMNWTWFLALDTQFFVITPLLVFILAKSRIAGFSVLTAIVVACVATTMAIIGYFGLPIHMFQEPIYPAYQTGYDKNVDYIYEKPYTRITPFAIGIALGYLFVKVPSYKLPGMFNGKLVAAIGWALSAALAIPFLWGFSMTGGWKWFPNPDPLAPQVMSLAARVIYGGLQRLGWSLIVGWVLFACNYGYGGHVNRILSLRFWRPLSNLTYGAYLVHMLTLQLYFASQRHMIFYSPLNMLTIFLSQLFLSYLVALIIAVLVEVPLLRLERLIIRRSL